MRRSIIVLLLAALAVAGIAVPVIAAEGSNTVLPGAEQEFFANINAERSDAGRQALRWHAGAASVARDHSHDMASDGQLRHNHNLANQMSNWRALGENVGQGPSVNAIHGAFMGSPSHRSNILDSSFTHVGVGVVERDGTLWVTEVFITPASSSSSGSTTQTSPAPKPPARRIVADPTVRTPVVRAATVSAPRPVAPQRTQPDPVVGTRTVTMLERQVDDSDVASANDGGYCSRGPC